MSTEYENLTNPKGRLPDLTLPVAGHDYSRRVRGSRRRAPVLLLFDRIDCAACWTFVDRLVESATELADWDGEVLVAIPGHLTTEDLAARPLPAGFSILEDPDSRLTSRLGIVAPALVIADQWAVVRYVESVGSDHRFPPPSEIVSWLRFIAIECPECQGEAL